MKKKLSFIVGGCAVVMMIVTAYALSVNPRAHEVVNYKPGHTHEIGDTQGAPQHSGGTDKFGCHNGSVPYHCH